MYSYLFGVRLSYFGWFFCVPPNSSKSKGLYLISYFLRYSPLLQLLILILCSTGWLLPFILYYFSLFCWAEEEKSSLQAASMFERPHLPTLVILWLSLIFRFHNLLIVSFLLLPSFGIHFLLLFFVLKPFFKRWIHHSLLD